MNYYETLFIVHPALESGRLKDIITSVEDNVKKLGGNQLSIELWGKKKLTYLIDKQKYGTYVLLQFSGEGKGNGELAVELEHNPNILAYLTTSIEESEVIEQEEDLDTQIAGKSREAERDDRRAKGGEETSKQETAPGAEDTESEAEVGTEEAAKEEETSEPVIELTEVSEEITETVTEDIEGDSEDSEPVTEESPAEEETPEPEPEPEIEEAEESVSEEIVPEPEAAASEETADSEPQEEEQKEESKEAAEETAAVKEEE